MSFVEFLMKYYIWILVVLIVAIVTVIGFLADARSKKKKAKEEVNMNSSGTDAQTTSTPVVPQPVNDQSIMTVDNTSSLVNSVAEPVGDLNLNNIQVEPVVEPQANVPVEPVAPVVEPQMSVPIEPVAPIVQPQMSVPVEPAGPVVQSQMSAPVEPVVPVVEPQMSVPVADNSGTQTLNDLNNASTFVTGNNN